MKTIIRILIYLNFVFWIGGFLFAFVQFFLYNGLGNIFEYIPAKTITIDKEINTMPRKLIYSYKVDDKVFKSSQNISTEILNEINIDDVIIYYNKTFVNFSMIGGLEERSSKAWDNLVGMIICGFFFLFTFSLYKFGNIDKWIKIYGG